MATITICDVCRTELKTNTYFVFTLAAKDQAAAIIRDVCPECWDKIKFYLQGLTASAQSQTKPTPGIPANANEADTPATRATTRTRRL